MLNITPINVDGKKADELRDELDLWIKKNSTEGVFNANKDLFFVKHPTSFAAWNTCNNTLIEWLGQLGLKIEGNGWVGNFETTPIKA